MGKAVLRGAVVLAAVLCAAPLWADDPPDAAPAPEKQKRKEDTNQKAARSAKDPVEEAFKLPRGVVLTPKQAKAYQQVRRQLEPPLRRALKRVQSGTDEVEKRKAVAEVKQIREQIRLALGEILQNPSFRDAKQAGKKGQGKNAHKGKKKGGRKKGRRRRHARRRRR